MTTSIGEKVPLKIPPIPKEEPHVCGVRNRTYWEHPSRRLFEKDDPFYTDRYSLWEPVGTLWKCPECSTWFKSVSGRYSTNIIWKKVRFLTPSWFRIKKFERNLK